MKVVCISGKARHGKDTACEMIKENLIAKNKKVIIVHYADLLKFICEKYFDWDGKKDEKGRTLLQYVGTDVVRKKEPTYWVNFVISVLRLFDEEWDVVLIPDCRFPNEIDDMKENFETLSVRVNRPNFTGGLTEEQLNHISETALDDYDFDAVISNDGDLALLRHNVDFLCQNLKLGE